MHSQHYLVRELSVRFIKKYRQCRAEWTIPVFNLLHQLNGVREIQRQNVRMFLSHYLLYKDLGRQFPVSV